MKPDTKYSLDQYRDFHCPTGGFLQAVLSNDLFEAFNRADDINQRDMFEIVSYIYNYLPTTCYGSKEAVKKWLIPEEKDNG